jgi:NAD(P)-dependent dehydrogenase (short-subunit alcohol dehydrogenase family)
VAAEIGGVACVCDITDTDSVNAALDKAAAAHGPARILMNVAGIGSRQAHRRQGRHRGAARRLRARGQHQPDRRLQHQRACIAARVREAGTRCPGGERGVMLFTASVAAFDGQVGQQAYSASKGGLVGMTLPMARDLAQHGDPRMHRRARPLRHAAAEENCPRPIQQSLAASIPFPPRLGKPSEFAELACHIVTNGHLNGEVIRLDGALRMAPR